MIQKTPTKDQYIIVGDFNAKLSGRTEEEENHIGPHVYNPDGEKRDRAKAEVKEHRELFMMAVIQNDFIVKTRGSRKRTEKQLRSEPKRQLAGTRTQVTLNK